MDQVLHLSSLPPTPENLYIVVGVRRGLEGYIIRPLLDHTSAATSKAEYLTAVNQDCYTLLTADQYPEFFL